jgi:hypothetical protein
MMLLMALAVTLAQPVSKPANEGAPSGKDLLDLCRRIDDEDPAQSGSADASTFGCLGYMSGFIDAIRTYEAILDMAQLVDNLHHARLLAKTETLPPERAAALATYYRKHIVSGQVPTEEDVRAVAALLTADTRSSLSQPICIPDGVTSTEQMALVIRKFLRDHPERLHESRAVLAVEALNTAFPCSAGPSTIPPR